MINRISIYGYLFEKEVDHIVRHEILFKNGERFLIKRTCLNDNFENPTSEISVNLFGSLSECICAVIKHFRNQEVRNNVYSELQVEEQLSSSYDPLVEELNIACQRAGLVSFSFFGHLCKYKPSSAAKAFLASMGYLIPTTKRPHVYLMDDFIKEEISFRHSVH